MHRERGTRWEIEKDRFVRCGSFFDWDEQDWRFQAPIARCGRPHRRTTMSYSYQVFQFWLVLPVVRRHELNKEAKMNTGNP